MEAVTSKAAIEKELQEKTNEYSKVCMELGHQIALRANLLKSIHLKKTKVIELNEKCALLKADYDLAAQAPSEPK